MMKIVIDAPGLAAGVGAAGVALMVWAWDRCAQSVINLSSERLTDWQTLPDRPKGRKKRVKSANQTAMVIKMR